MVRLCFVALELMMLVFLLPGYLYKPQDKHLGWYLVLLVLLIFYNMTGGIFPNARYAFPLHVQHIMAYGSGFLTASYFPFYFYKAFNLRLLRWHALYGVPLFLLLPYVALLVVSCVLNQDLRFTVRWGLFAPFIYSIVLLRVIFLAIRAAYIETRDKDHYLEEISVYCAVVPWSALAVIVYFDLGQLTEVLLTNLGFLTITLIFIVKTIRKGREDYRVMRLSADELFSAVFEANCLYYGLTKTETEITRWLYRGLSNREIADKLFKSEDTIKKHVHNIFVKIGVKNRSALIRVMQTAPEK